MSSPISKPVWTEPDDSEWVQRVFEICRPYLDEPPTARTAPYMTDAANLLKVYAGAPTVVLGPGEAAMAHQTDEYAARSASAIGRDLRGADPRLVRVGIEALFWKRVLTPFASGA